MGITLLKSYSRKILKNPYDNCAQGFHLVVKSSIIAITGCYAYNRLLFLLFLPVDVFLNFYRGTFREIIKHVFVLIPFVFLGLIISPRVHSCSIYSLACKFLSLLVVFEKESECDNFLFKHNSLHQSLQFTFENEENNSLFRTKTQFRIGRNKIYPRQQWISRRSHFGLLS